MGWLVNLSIKKDSIPALCWSKSLTEAIGQQNRTAKRRRIDDFVPCVAGRYSLYPLLFVNSLILTKILPSGQIF
jgi:hypothetical protein